MYICEFTSKNEIMKRFTSILAIMAVVLAAVCVSACGSDDDNEKDEPQPPQPPKQEVKEGRIVLNYLPHNGPYYNHLWILTPTPRPSSTPSPASTRQWPSRKDTAWRASSRTPIQ